GRARREGRAGLALLGLDFGAEAVAVARHGRDRDGAALLHEAHRRITAFERPVDLHRVPVLGVAHIPDRHVVVLAPEERHGIEALAASQHVARGDLTLTLGDDPVLDTDSLTGMRIRSAYRVAGREHSSRSGFA